MINPTLRYLRTQGVLIESSVLYLLSHSDQQKSIALLERLVREGKRIIRSKDITLSDVMELWGYTNSVGVRL